MTNSDKYQHERDAMVRDQIAARGVVDPRVLQAMRQVPREQFVQASLRPLAHADRPLPIGSGQTISQPYIVALMTEALGLSDQDNVLEIGTGSGYAAAVLSLVCARVVTIECIDTLASQAKETLERLGYENIDVIVGDGSLGCPAQAPFNAIVATAGGPHVPASLKAQLAINGRLVMPVGDRERYQSLIRMTRIGEDDYQRDDLGEVRFVPLIGAEGWRPQGADQ